MRRPSLASYVRFYREDDRVLSRLRGELSSAIFRKSLSTVKRLRRNIAARYKYLFRRAAAFYFSLYLRRRPRWAKKIRDFKVPSREWWRYRQLSTVGDYY